MTSQYSYVRFRWIPADINELEITLSDFEVDRRKLPTSINDISPYRKYRDYLLARSDTLIALASPLRAIITQREKSPFTLNDMKLREIILQEYPKKSSTFFPWGFSKEPEFEVQREIPEIEP